MDLDPVMRQTPEQSSTQTPVAKVRYPAVWKRLIADLVDSTFLDFCAAFMTAVAMGALYWMRVLLKMDADLNQSLFFKDLESNLILGVILFFRGVLSLGYYTWGHFRYGTTLGKRFFRIAVISTLPGQSLSLRQSLFRTLNYLTSYLPFCGGFLLAIFHPQKKALHDLLADTVSVIREPAK